MSTQRKNGRHTPINIPNDNKLIFVRMLNRKNGIELFGKDASDESCWRATPEAVVEIVQEKIDKLTAPRHTTAADIQIHIYNYNKNGEVNDDEKWSGRASNFSDYVEKYVKKVNS